MQKEKITGIILAGGLSSRMKKDKGMVEIAGKKFIEHVINALKKAEIDTIIIIANNANYNNLGYHVFRDIIPGCGPVGGIYTGLRFSNTEKNVILSIDIPFVSPVLIRYLLDNSNNHEITIPVHDGFSEPLCGVYKRVCDERFGLATTRGKHRLQDVIRTFDLQKIDISSKEFNTDLTLANINSPDELIKFKEILHEN